MASRSVLARNGLTRADVRARQAREDHRQPSAPESDRLRRARSALRRRQRAALLDAIRRDAGDDGRAGRAERVDRRRLGDEDVRGVALHRRADRRRRAPARGIRSDQGRPRDLLRPGEPRALLGQRQRAVRDQARGEHRRRRASVHGQPARDPSGSNGAAGRHAAQHDGLLDGPFRRRRARRRDDELRRGDARAALRRHAHGGPEAHGAHRGQRRRRTSSRSRGRSTIPSCSKSRTRRRRSSCAPSAGASPTTASPAISNSPSAERPIATRVSVAPRSARAGTSPSRPAARRRRTSRSSRRSATVPAAPSSRRARAPSARPRCGRRPPRRRRRARESRSSRPSCAAMCSAVSPFGFTASGFAPASSNSSYGVRGSAVAGLAENPDLALRGCRRARRPSADPCRR